jgi:proteasome accessory factor B
MPLKNPPTARQWELIAALKKSKGATLQSLADQFDVDERTVRRDLTAMKKSGLPILELTEAHGRKLWYIRENPLTPAQFNFEEAAALYLGHRFLTPLVNSSLWEAARNGLHKIRQQLGTEYVRILDQLLDTFHESTTGWSDYSQQSDIITTLMRACEDKQETAIRYRSLEATKEESYTIHPYALITQVGTLYVIGFSCKRNEVRTWKLNRIAKAECLNTKFKKPKDFDADTYRQKGFGIFVFNEESVQKVRIKVDRWMARYVQEHHWHETQHFEEQPDGSVMVQFEVVPTHELINWILKFGRHAEVLEPASLRQEVKTEIAEMLQLYQGKE